VKKSLAFTTRFRAQ